MSKRTRAASDDDYDWMLMESIGFSNRTFWLIAITGAAVILAVFIWLATL